tara:strand:- start:553 stop:1293 length:741 start_codon:yes stop_codon:yes gene_type:complete
MTCKNCNHKIDGSYCSQCGQSTTVSRISFGSFLKELSSSVFQVDKGLLFSIKELFIRPGHSIKEYLSGKRKNHFKPIAYTFTLSTIYFLISQLLEAPTFLNDAAEGFASESNSSGVASGQIDVLNWFAKNYAYTTLLLLPLYSFASYMAFNKSGLNYPEHFVLNAYITGQQAIIYTLSALLSLAITNKDLLATGTLIVSISYAFFVFWQFFEGYSRIAALLRFVLTYILFLLILLPVLFVVFYMVK